MDLTEPHLANKADEVASRNQTRKFWSLQQVEVRADALLKIITLRLRLL